MARPKLDRDAAKVAAAPFDEDAFEAAMGKQRRRRVSRVKKRERHDAEWNDYALSVSQGRRRGSSSRRVRVVDGAHDDPEFGEDAAEDGAVEYDDDPELEPDEPTTERERLLAQLAQANATLAALGATESAPEDPGPEDPDDDGNADSVDESPLLGDEGDSIADLATLEALIAGGNYAEAGDLPGLRSEVASMLDEEDETENDDESFAADAKGAAYMPKSKTANWCTGPKIKNAVDRVFTDGIDLDPCCFDSPHYLMGAKTRWYGPDFDDVDGLAMPWFGDVYVNCPYDSKSLHAWAEKIVLEVTAGDDEGINVIALLPAKTEQGWFQDDVLETAARVCYVRGRLHFGGSEDSATFGSIVVLWSNDPEVIARFDKAFGLDIVDKAGNLVPLDRRKKGHRSIGKVLPIAS